MDGIDEDHCGELEYNECDENEYRCDDGSCIPEQYWLDGTYDCSDRSDEQVIDNYVQFPCALASSKFLCDEATAYRTHSACGDGEFKDSMSISCYNYRMCMFSCEFCIVDPYNSHISMGERAWTLENGHCVSRGQIPENLNDVTEAEKCLFYLKCKLTNGKTTGCDDVIRAFDEICTNKTINYPPGPVFKPYAQTVYQLFQLNSRSLPNYVYFNGSIKCIGYQARSDLQNISVSWSTFQSDDASDRLFCNYFAKTWVSTPNIHEHCWKETQQSFFCPNSLQCISKHRLRDYNVDCILFEDEHANQTCYMENKHRLNCSGKSYCLSVSKIGDGIHQCLKGGDEYILPLKWILSDRICTVPNSVECNFLRTYIKAPSSLLTMNNDKVLLFRQYCDTLWHLPRGFDESRCKQWKCPKDRYQCLSGHCIPIDSTRCSPNLEWNCPDASDNIGFLGITKLSEHNAKLFSRCSLQDMKTLLTLRIKSKNSPFMRYCNVSKEYGCVLANVSDPSNFTINRPCIHLTQIGDGIVDCYGGLDERNLLSCGDNLDDQRGFDFHCSNQQCIPFSYQCFKRCTNKADSLLCDQLKTMWNTSCVRSPYHRCETVDDKCNPIRGKMDYYCDESRRGK